MMNGRWPTVTLLTFITHRIVFAHHSSFIEDSLWTFITHHASIIIGFAKAPFPSHRMWLCMVITSTRLSTS
jgi:hypothetical protein